MSVACLGRRSLIKKLFIGASGIAMAGTLPAQAFSLGQPKLLSGERSLTFYNRHTGERQTNTYWIDGQYQSDAINGLNYLLRDHRQNLPFDMDPALYDLLYALQSKLDSRKEIHIISGYRSPTTNAMLAARSGGVAKNSYHTKGMAMDIAIPGIELNHIRRAALSLEAGGVGYYPRSGFVHIDTGRKRFW